MLKPALDIANGQMLFRDTFTQYGALTSLLHALPIHFFGNYLYIIQLQTALFYGLISICLWYLWGLFLPSRLATISVLIWLLIAPYFVWTMLPWSSVPALLFQLLSLIIILRALQINSRWMIMFAGCLAVLVFWCRQSTGVFHCMSILILIITYPILIKKISKGIITDCIYYLMGIITMSVPFVLWLVFNGAFQDMYLQSIKAAFYFGIIKQNVNIGFNNETNIIINLFIILLQVLKKLLPLHYDGSGTSPMWSILPLTCLFLCTKLLFNIYYNQDRKNIQLPLYGLILVSLFSWLQYYPVNCIRHCYWAATPMIGLIPFLALGISNQQKQQYKNFIICITLVAIFGLDISYRIYHGIRRISNHSVKVEEPQVLRYMYATPYKARLYKRMSVSLNNALKSSPSPYLLTLSNDPLYLTFIGPQDNYHPMYIDWGIFNQFIYPDFIQRRNLFINKNKPIILGLDDTAIPDAIRVDIFNATGYNQNSKLALYMFSDKGIQ